MSDQLDLFQNYEDLGPDSPQGMVEHFHHKFQCSVDDREVTVIRTRLTLIREEYRELKDELDGAWLSLSQGYPIANLHKIAKESADLLYVVYGTAVALGIDLEEAFRRVHESNMSKLGADGQPIFRQDGKVLKGENYFEPDMTGTYREEDDG
jgi:NTP pyrophosphatase (non-canonical NTP hydrolase)